MNKYNVQQIKRYIEVNRDEHPNICEILDLMLDEMATLSTAIRHLELVSKGKSDDQTRMG